MDVPIIGQPKIKQWALSLVIECTCGVIHMWVGKPGQAPPTVCRCGKAYQLARFPVARPDGELDVALMTANIPQP